MTIKIWDVSCDYGTIRLKKRAVVGYGSTNFAISFMGDINRSDVSTLFRTQG